MPDIDPTELDETGKVILDHIYDRATPVQFYKAVSALDYCIPHLAQPIFSSLISFLDGRLAGKRPRVIDLGCSYGVNGALLKSRRSLAEIFQHYEGQEMGPELPHDLIETERAFYGQLNEFIDLIGVDLSMPALEYAQAAGFIDQKLQGNFEVRDLMPPEVSLLQNSDLLISTGCIGYVGHLTISRLLAAILPKRPLMAHFVLRTFSFDRIASDARALGYQVFQSRRSYKQRRFASDAERNSALNRLRDMSIDPQGLEKDGWYYADLFLCLPDGIAFSSLPEAVRAEF